MIKSGENRNFFTTYNSNKFLQLSMLVQLFFFYADFFVKFSIHALHNLSEKEFADEFGDCNL